MKYRTGADVSVDLLLDLFRHMVTAREMDLLEQDYTRQGEAFFHVSGAGHEATAALNPHLIPEDWLHVHYRDKALMLARGIQPEMFFHSLFNKDGSHSRGRQMNAHMSAPELNIMSLVGPVGNSPLQAAGVATVIKDKPARPIVLCAVGDGMTQQGESLEGLAQVARDRLPVLVLVEDNAFAISTKTRGRTFYSLPDGRADSVFGIPITHMDGRDPVACYEQFGRIIPAMRETREPMVVVFEADRLQNHTNADDQRMYRTPEEIEALWKTGDPIANLEKELLARDLQAATLKKIIADTRAELKETARRVQRSAEPAPVFTSLKPLEPRLLDASTEYRGSEHTGISQNNGRERLTMLEAIREVFRARMAKDERITLFGEDIEDPKGDVFGITRGLTQTYPGRVVNSPLAEASIVGISVGQALAGKRPVAFLQFADFLPIAYNQIFAELGSMYWRTDGRWQAPVIVMITCGGYKPGLGPFHASSMEAIATHTPGVDVVMPSTAGDAAGLLNAAFESGRPTLYFYPKNCLNDRENATSPDVHRQLVPLGRARTVRRGDDLTLVAWGNTVSHCRQAAAALAGVGIECDLIDLRSLMPWDQPAVLESVERTGRLIVVHEDNHTNGFGAEVVATVAERATRKITARRVTRADTYVPCNFGNQLEVLPSYKRVLETAVELLGGQIEWKGPQTGEKNVYLVEAIGSSPSDESVTIVEWKIKPGDTIEDGAQLATLEADKAAIDLSSPVGGTVAELLIEEGDMVKVGTPILKVRTGSKSEDDGSAFEHVKPITREEPGIPIITGLSRKKASDRSAAPAGRPAGTPAVVVSIAGIASARGKRTVSNEEIAALSADWDAGDIFKRTGIASRPWLAEGETALSIALEASRKLLAAKNLGVRDIDLIICSTETPMQNTPSMATLIQNGLANGDEEALCAAYDVNAACSGYIYALQIAYDYLQSSPGHRVLVVTTEALSPRLDLSDFGTAPIFGDASTATIIAAGETALSGGLRVHRPVIGAHGEDGSILRVPSQVDRKIYMDGPKVFLEAIKDMMMMLNRACSAAEISTDELDLIVPHQANQRIINAIRQRMKVPREKMYSNIANNGNTSSSTIPLCLEEILAAGGDDRYLGITAFGGGFTFGGGVLERPR